MSTHKDFRFTVEMERSASPWVTARAAHQRPLEITTPPAFHGGVEGFWSPEDLLVAAVASCYELTLRAIAERRDLHFRDVDVTATGHVTKLADGRLGFLAIELDVRLEVEAGDEGTAEAAARRAHEYCIVGHALAVPVELRLALRTPGLVAA
jgi:organic hydroperoxide reductase OsmC/OhrA